MGSGAGKKNLNEFHSDSSFFVEKHKTSSDILLFGCPAEVVSSAQEVFRRENGVLFYKSLFFNKLSL
jgi:hypothetical protein